MRFGENLENCLQFSESVLFFSIFASGVRNLAECAEKGVFGRIKAGLIKAFSVEMPETSFSVCNKP